MERSSILELRDFGVRYGDMEAVKNLSLEVTEGSAVGLTGRNGAGKTSTLKGVMGLVEAEGAVVYKGRELGGMEPHRRVSRGIGYLPQERRVFPRLTVEENLTLVSGSEESTPMREKALSLFPELSGHLDQLAGNLSGGEQVMLSLVRLLARDPELMLVDEPTEGLMPDLTERVGRLIASRLGRGCSAIVTEQNVDFLESFATKILHLSRGRVDRA